MRLCLGTLKSCAIRRKYDCSNPCSFRDITFFKILSKIFLKNVEKFQNFKELNPTIEIYESFLTGLRILPLNSAAQILVVFEI